MPNNYLKNILKKSWLGIELTTRSGMYAYRLGKATTLTSKPHVQSV